MFFLEYDMLIFLILKLKSQNPSIDDWPLRINSQWSFQLNLLSSSIFASFFKEEKKKLKKLDTKKETIVNRIFVYLIARDELVVWNFTPLRSKRFVNGRFLNLSSLSLH